MNNTQVSVKKHEGKIRLHIEWPVDGDDPDLMRKHDWDIPVVHALALAAGLLGEAVGLLRFPAKPERTEEAMRKRMDSKDVTRAPLLEDMNRRRVEAGLPTFEAGDDGSMRCVQCFTTIVTEDHVCETPAADQRMKT